MKIFKKTEHEHYRNLIRNTYNDGVIFIPKKLSLKFAWCLLLYFLVSAVSYAQKMSIASFHLDEKDLTANTQGTMDFDLNGDKCAIIKIETTQHNFTFDVGSIGITKVVNQNSEHPGEIWLYVPHGVKQISIQHPLLGTIRDYDFGLRVKKGKTYVLKLTTDQVNTLVVDYDNSQYLVLDVYPKNAEVYFNGIPFKLNELGRLEMPLAFGTHSYRITAPDYHPVEGQVTIQDKKNKQNLSIRLKQAFGYVSFLSPSSEFDGADIYIDNVAVGKLPLEKFPVRSGMHNVSVSKELYLNYEDNFAVTDSSFISLTPIFEPNFANVTISTVKDAQIFDNGKLLGTGKWQGRLGTGEHTIEVKKISHRTVLKKLSLIKGESRMVSMESPTPIYGALEITSSPTEAEVYIDDKKIGTTPFINSAVLVGKHKVELKKKGYKSELEVVDINEDAICRLNKELSDYCSATISSNINADIYIDGDKKGKTPYKLDIVAGTYSVELKSRGYSAYSKKMKLDGSTDDIYVKMRRNLVRDYEFYMQAGYNPIGFKSWNIGIGGFIKNFNLEANYLGGTSKSETIYITTGFTKPEPAVYTPHGGNIKLGYGVRCTSRLRFTPQIGFQFISLKEDFSGIYHFEDGNYNYTSCLSFADKSKTTSCTFGARISFAVLPWLGISATPEYALPIHKSEGYKVLSKVSSKIDKFNKGFNCTLNLNVFF